MTPTKIPKLYTIQMTQKVIFGICAAVILTILAGTITYNYVFNNWLQPKQTFECPIGVSYKLEDEHKKQRLTQKIIQRYHTEYQYTKNIVEYAYIYSKNTKFLTPEIILAVIATESSFRQYAVSKAGAEGLTQVLPQYAKYDWDRFHPAINIANGVDNLKEQYRLANNNLQKAIMLYNVGYTNFKRGVRNREYVAKVNKNLEWLKSS